jgi:hypothetical protein
MEKKTLCINDAKQSWRHPKELKYMAVIAHNQKQKVTTKQAIAQSDFFGLTIQSKSITNM